MFTNGESVSLLPLARRRRVSMFQNPWMLRDEPVGGDPAAAAGGGGGEGGEPAATPPPDAGESDIKEQFATAQRREQKLYENLGAKNAEEADKRIADLLEAEAHAGEQPTPATPAVSAAPAAEPEWMPAQGRPKMPRMADEKYEKDTYHDLTDDGRRQYEDDMAIYHERLSEFGHHSRTQTDLRESLPENLKVAIDALPENWRKAPEKWPFKVPYDEVLADIVGGMAHAGLDEGVVAGADNIGSAREILEAIVRHVVAQETATADSEAETQRKGQPPEPGAGTPGGEPAVAAPTPLSALKPTSSREAAKQATVEHLRATRGQ